MDFDAKVRACFKECCVRRFGEDPTIESACNFKIKTRLSFIHLRFCDASFLIGLLSCT